MQEILGSVASSEGVPLVDIVGALERKTPDGIAGLDVLLDYVHPTPESQETIAQEVIEALDAGRLLPGPPAIPPGALRSAGTVEFEPAVEARAVESLYLQYLVMRQYDKMEAMYRRYVDTMAKVVALEPGLRGYCQVGLNFVNRIQPVLRDYARLLRAEKLGLLEQEFGSEEAQAIYRAYVEVIYTLESRGMSREAFLQQVPGLSNGTSAALPEDGTPGR
jgi:hypothetical protein